MVEFHIRTPGKEDIEWMTSSFADMGWSKPEGHFEKYIQYQSNGLITVLCAETQKGEYVGHLKIVWNPEHYYFRQHGIPEIQDLNVLPQYRRMKVATILVERAEEIVGARSSKIGIGFGLYSDYGSAQKMYVQRGYVPDGQGISYRNIRVQPGDIVTADDDLVLFLTKGLAKGDPS
jgi:GNAT superfamily N-acetyltransferase